MDSRDGPIGLAKSVKLAPDLVFNTNRTTAQEAADEVFKIRQKAGPRALA